MFQNDQGCLLRRTDSSENTRLLVFFMRDSGLQNVLTRRRTKANSGDHLPDLFELGELTIEQRGSGKPAWLKEWVPGHRFDGIAHSYKALAAASSFARFYEKNLVHMETFEDAWNLLQRVLQSLARGDQPGIVLLKGLYAFARREGYPVREQWLSQQAPPQQRRIINILNQPVMASQGESEFADTCIRDLEQYFRGETDLLVPDP